MQINNTNIAKTLDTSHRPVSKIRKGYTAISKLPKHKKNLPLLPELAVELWYEILHYAHSSQAKMTCRKFCQITDCFKYETFFNNLEEIDSSLLHAYLHQVTLKLPFNTTEGSECTFKKRFALIDFKLTDEVNRWDEGNNFLTQIKKDYPDRFDPAGWKKIVQWISAHNLILFASSMPLNKKFDSKKGPLPPDHILEQAAEIREWLQNNDYSSLQFYVSHMFRDYVRHPHMIEVPTEIGLFKGLKQLNISNEGDLIALPETIGQLSNLTSLSLEKTKVVLSSRKPKGRLPRLPESIINLKNLTVLKVTNNRLENLPESIGKLSKLTLLDLSFNRLTELPDSIAELRNLTQLFVVHNRIKTFPEAIIGLPNSTIIYCKENPLSEDAKEKLKLHFTTVSLTEKG